MKQKKLNIIRIGSFSDNLNLYVLIFFIFLTYEANAQLPIYLCNCSSMIDSKYFNITHYHKIDGHTRFGAKTKIKDFCVTPEFWGSFNVASDGTTSSILEIKGQTSNCLVTAPIELIIHDSQGQPIGNSMPDIYGEFKLLNSHNGKHTFSYKHPTLVPEDGSLYGTIYVSIKPLMGQDDNLGYILINYYRPGIAMIHGLWSNGGAFKDMKDQMVSTGNYSDYQIFPADYEGTNDKSFSTNFLVPPLAIAQVISDLRANDIAAGKVDVVCHSMGGILTRRYLNNPLYEGNNDIRRVITCNTPHAGSQMANFLQDSTLYGITVATLLNMAGKNCNGGAVSDLRVGTTLINGVAYAGILGDAKVHAIRTNANVTAMIFSANAAHVNFATFIAALVINQCSGVFLTDVFDSPLHDAIVAAESQDGGLTGVFHVSTSFPPQEHMGSVANTDVIERVDFLLNYPTDDPYFTDTYSGFSLGYSLNLSCLPFRDNGKTVSRFVADVEITSPMSGANINSGTNLTINYATGMVDSVIATLSFHPDSVVVVANAGNANSLQLPVPANVYGIMPLVLVGFDETKTIVDIDSVMVNFTTAATLDSISIYPETFYLNQGDTISFTLSGHYSDGVIRNITKDSDLIFDFVEDNASKYAQTNIKMDGLADDTLYITKGLVTSDTILIKKIGTNFPANCHIVSNTNSNGAGSLKLALECVAANDIIIFTSQIAGDTIIIDSFSVNIEKSMKIINNNSEKIMIRTSFSTVINVFADSEVWLENLILVSDNPSNNCINNYGNLTIKNVECRTLEGEKASIYNEKDGTIEMMGSNVIK